MATVRVNRLCEFCGTPLQGVRRDARYCSRPGKRSCRDRAFQQRLADVGEVLTWRDTPTRLDGIGASGGGIALPADRGACQAAFLAETNARSAGLQPWQGRLELISEKAPGAVARLGAAAVEAAVRPMDGDLCRHCWAAAIATGRGMPRPPVDRATTILLGRACQRCLDLNMQGLAASVSASITPTRSATTAARAKAVGTDPRGHPRDCAKCHAAQALTASAARYGGATLPAEWQHLLDVSTAPHPVAHASQLLSDLRYDGSRWSPRWVTP